LIGLGIKNKVHWNAIRILQTTPESWRESDGNFRKAFWRVPDPCAANEQRDLLEVLVIALAATPHEAQNEFGGGLVVER
jgi:hypothetical protein